MRPSNWTGFHRTSGGRLSDRHPPGVSPLAIPISMREGASPGTFLVVKRLVHSAPVHILVSIPVYCDYFAFLLLYSFILPSVVRLMSLVSTVPTRYVNISSAMYMLGAGSHQRKPGCLAGWAGAVSVPPASLFNSHFALSAPPLPSA